MKQTPVMTHEGRVYCCQLCAYKTNNVLRAVAHVEGTHKIIYCVDREGHIYDAGSPEILRSVGAM